MVPGAFGRPMPVPLTFPDISPRPSVVFSSASDALRGIEISPGDPRPREGDSKTFVEW